MKNISQLLKSSIVFFATSLPVCLIAQNNYFPVPSGNVGVGTVPAFKFHIRGGNANSSGMTLGGTTTGNFALTSADGGSYGLYMGVSNTGNAWLQVGRHDQGQVIAYHLLLQGSGGNVGIGAFGTSSPSYRLEVKGNIVNSNPSQGWIGLTGDLPGYATDVYPTLKTSGPDLYFSTGGYYTGYIGNGGIFGLFTTGGGYNVQLNASGSSFLNGGYLGIGTNLPGARLDVSENSSVNTVQVLRRGVQTNGASADPNMVTTFGKPYLMIGGSEFITTANSIQTIGFGYSANGCFQPAEIGFLTNNTTNYESGDIVFANRNGTSNIAPTEVMRISSNGNVGIGTTHPDAAGASAYKLSVLGAIRCNKVVVEIGWADYVFNTSYKLMPLNDLEKFVSTNKHLPNIPSGCEVEDKGLDVGAVQAKQMEKIEELTLYIIDMNKKMQEQNKRIAELEKSQAKK